MARDNHPSQCASPADLRDRADHARRLARDLTTQRDRNSLLSFAEELERRAAELVAAGGHERPGPQVS